MTPKEALNRAARYLDEDDKKLDEAVELCAAVLKSAPRNARAFYVLAAVLRKKGRGKEAAEAAAEAARLRPDLQFIQITAGYMLRREKLYGRALALYEAALAQDPGITEYHLGTASALRKLGRGREATAALLKAAAAAAITSAGAGIQAQAQYKLGQHLRSTGDPADCALAAAAYGRCLELEPGHALAAYWLAATRKLAAAGAAGVPNAPGSNGEADIATGGGDGVRAAAAAESPPAAAPREYVVGLYNSYAETFDAHLQGALAYRTPAVIVESLGVLFPGRRYRRCLDLGCGTGLSGRAVSSVCGSVVGIDLSPAMVEKARQKRVYRRLLVGDVTETVKRLCRESRAKDWDVPRATGEEGGGVSPAVATEAAAEVTARSREGGAAAAPSALSAVASIDGVAADGQDADSPAPEDAAARATRAAAKPAPCGGGRGELVISCDVFVYVGDLRPCFGAVRELLAAGSGRRTLENEAAGDRLQEPAAIFAFSAEAPPHPQAGDEMGGRDASGQGYELQGTGRYTHDREYLETVCRESGFRVLAAESVVLRKNAGIPVNGFIFITEAVL